MEYDNIELIEKKSFTGIERTWFSLNSYGASCIEMTDGWFYSAELKNEKNFSDEEKSEILLSICSDEEEDVCYNNCDVDVMEENGWYLDNTEWIERVVNGEYERYYKKQYH